MLIMIFVLKMTPEINDSFYVMEITFLEGVGRMQ